MNLTNRSELTKLGISDPLLSEILNDGILAVQLVNHIPNEKNDGGMIVAIYRPLSSVIQINKNINREFMSKYLSDESGVKIFPDETFPFLLLHEVGHSKHYESEEEADMYALTHLQKMRKEKFQGQWKELGLQIGSAIQNGIAEGIKQAFREVFSPNRP